MRGSEISRKLDYLNGKLSSVKEIREKMIAAIGEHVREEEPESAPDVVARSIISSYEAAMVVVTDMEDWFEKDELRDLLNNIRRAQSSLQYYRSRNQGIDWKVDERILVSQEDLIPLMHKVGSTVQSLLQSKISDTRRKIESLVN